MKFRDKLLSGILSLIILAGFIPLSYYEISPGPVVKIINNLDGVSVFAKKMNVYTFIGKYFNKNTELLKVKDLGNEQSLDLSYNDSLIKAKEAALYTANVNYKMSIDGWKVKSVSSKSKLRFLKTDDVILAIDNIDLTNKKIDSKLNIKELINRTVKLTYKTESDKIITKNIKLDNHKAELVLVESISFSSDNKSYDKLDLTYKSNRINGSSFGLAYGLGYLAKLYNFDFNKKIVATGEIDDKGNISEIKGIREKLISAVSNKAELFIVPEANYDEVLNAKTEFNYKIQIIKVKTLKEAMSYLNDYEFLEYKG